MIELYTYRMIRAAFLRNVARFSDKREAVDYMLARRREYAPQLTVH